MKMRSPSLSSRAYSVAVILILLAALLLPPLRAQEVPLESEPKPVLPPQPPPPHATSPSWKNDTWRRSHSSSVVFRKNVVIKRGESIHDLVVVGGDLVIEGEARGDVVVVFGSATIRGKVGRDLVVVMGGVDLGPDSVVEGELYAIGGPSQEAAGAVVEGDQYVFSFLGPDEFLPNLNWLRDWFLHGLLWGRPLPHQFRWTWGLVGIFLFIYVLLCVLFPRPVRSCFEAVQERPLASFSLGIVSLVLLGPILFLLVVSVAGILVIPILLCALFGAVVFGKTAVYAYAGQQFTRPFSTGQLHLPLWAGLGLLFFYLLYMVPVLGFVAWGIATILALGSVLLAAFGGGRHETAEGRHPIRTGSQPPPTITSLAHLSPQELVLLPRVGFWRRFLASLLDLVLLGLILATFESYFLVIWAAYHIALWTWRGTTIGGIVLGIKIIRADGSPLTFPVALVRSLSSFFSAVVLFLGFFWAGWDKDKQAWHDKIAGTAVVQVPRGTSLL